MSDNIHSEGSVESEDINDNVGNPPSSSESSVESGTGDQNENEAAEETKVFLHGQHTEFLLHNPVPSEFVVYCDITTKAENRAKNAMMEECSLENSQIIESGRIANKRWFELIPGGSVSISDGYLSVKIGLEQIDEEPFVCRLDLEVVSPECNMEFILEEKRGIKEIVNLPITANEDCEKSFKLQNSVFLTLHSSYIACP